MEKNNKVIIVVVLVIVALGLGFIFLQSYAPKETKRALITIKDGQVVDSIPLDDLNGEVNIQDTEASEGNEGEPEIYLSEDEPIVSGKQVITKEIMITDGVKHSVDLKEILGGGPPKDGIPSIDDPKFVAVSEASFVTDEEPGIAVSLNGIDRFYPFQILVWHEMVNDTFGSQRVLVTYCPLCLSGIVFDPLVKGERATFNVLVQHNY